MKQGCFKVRQRTFPVTSGRSSACDSPSWRGVLRALWFLAIALGVSSPAEAQTWTWVGTATNANWHTASNWSPASVPPETADVVIGTGVGSIVIADADVRVATLTWNRPMTLNAGRALRVTTGTQRAQITLGNGASIVGGTYAPQAGAIILPAAPGFATLQDVTFSTIATIQSGSARLLGTTLASPMQVGGGSTLTVLPGSIISNQIRQTLNGTVNLTVSGPGTLTIAPAGRLQGAFTIGGTGAIAMRNEGELRTLQTNHVIITQSNVSLENAATIRVEIGQIQTQGPFTNLSTGVVSSGNAALLPVSFRGPADLSLGTLTATEIEVTSTGNVNLGGRTWAPNARLMILNGTLRDGTLNLGTGLLRSDTASFGTVPTGTLQNITLTGEIRIGAGSFLNLNTVTGPGILLVGPDGTSTWTTVRVGGSAILNIPIRMQEIVGSFDLRSGVAGTPLTIAEGVTVESSASNFFNGVVNRGTIRLTSTRTCRAENFENNGLIEGAANLATNIEFIGMLSGTGSINTPGGLAIVRSVQQLSILSGITAGRLRFEPPDAVSLSALPGGVLTLRAGTFQSRATLSDGTIEFASGSGRIQGESIGFPSFCATFRNIVVRGNVLLSGLFDFSQNVNFTGSVGCFGNTNLVYAAGAVLTYPIDTGTFTLQFSLKTAGTITLASGVELRAPALTLGGSFCGGGGAVTFINRGTLTLTTTGDAIVLTGGSTVAEYGVINAPLGRVSYAGNLPPGGLNINAARVLLTGPIDLQGETLDLATLGYTLSGNVSNGRLILGAQSLNVAPLTPPASQVFTNLTIAGDLRLRLNGMRFFQCMIESPVGLQDECADIQVSHDTRFLNTITGSPTCNLIIRLLTPGEFVLGPSPISSAGLTIAPGTGLVVTPQTRVTLSGPIDLGQTAPTGSGAFWSLFPTAVNAVINARSEAKFASFIPTGGRVQTRTVVMTDTLRLADRPTLQAQFLTIESGGIDLSGSEWRPEFQEINVRSGAIRNGRFVPGGTIFNLSLGACNPSRSLADVSIVGRLLLRGDGPLILAPTASLPDGITLLAGSRLFLLYPSEAQANAPGELPHIEVQSTNSQVIIIACSRNLILPAGREIAGGGLTFASTTSSCVSNCTSTFTIEGRIANDHPTERLQTLAFQTLVNRGVIETSAARADILGPFRNDGVFRTSGTANGTIASIDPLSTGSFDGGGNGISIGGGLPVLSAPATFAGNVAITGTTNLQGAIFRVPDSNVRIATTISNGTLDMAGTQATFGFYCGTPATLTDVLIRGDLRLVDGRIRLANSTIDGNITVLGTNASQIELDSNMTYNGIISAGGGGTLHIGALRNATLTLGPSAWIRAGRVLGSMPGCQVGQTLTIVNNGVLETHSVGGFMNLPTTLSGPGPRWGPTRVGAVDESVAFASATPTSRAHFSGTRAVSSVPVSGVIALRSLYLQDSSLFGISPGEVLRLDAGQGRMRTSTLSMLALHGDIEGSVENLGLVSLPSNRVASVSGGYVQNARITPRAATRFRLAGNQPGQTFSRLAVAGPAALEGVLEVVIDPGTALWTPTIGSTFDVLSATAGLTLAPGTSLRVMMTASGASALGLSLPTATGRVPADTEPLVLLPETTFVATVVDGTTLRLEARRASCAIASVPSAATGCIGVPVVLASSVNGTFAGVRWQVQSAGGDWTDLINGPTAGVGVVSGASATTLRIERLAASAAVRATYTAACGPLPSDPVLITRVAGCSVADIANVDGQTAVDGVCPDGVLTNADFMAFVAAFFASADDPRRVAADIADTDGLPSADGGPDGYVDNGDFTAFFRAYFEGC
jgi:hypothetical protein